MGPTCTGKTDISIRLSNLLPLELVSVDSSMIYKYMDIGTNKPPVQLLTKIKHNLINIRNPNSFYSVFDFYNDSVNIINISWKKNKIPLLVGGSMMYFWFLQTFMKKKFNFVSFLNIAIVPIDKYKLYDNIKKRFYKMINNGFIDEVYFLRSKNYINKTSQSIKSIGYEELWLYLEGQLTFTDAEKHILTSTYLLAKKQLLWIKRWKDNLIILEDMNYNSFTYLLNIIQKHIY